MSDFTLDTSRFNYVMRELERRGVATMPQIVRAEAGVVLKACMVRTRIPAVDRVDAGSRLMATRGPNRMPGLSREVEAGDGYVVAGVRMAQADRAGRVWLRSSRARRKFILVYGNGGAATGNVIGRKTYARLTAARDRFAQNLSAEIAAGRKTMGLAKQSWLQSLQDLGVDVRMVKGGGNLSGRDLAMAQNASGRRNSYKNGIGMQNGNGFQFVVTIRNSLPYARSPKVRLDVILQSVITGRVKQFERLVSKGYGDNMAAIAKAYPNLGLTVST